MSLSTANETEDDIIELTDVVRKGAVLKFLDGTWDEESQGDDESDDVLDEVDTSGISQVDSSAPIFDELINSIDFPSQNIPVTQNVDEDFTDIDSLLEGLGIKKTEIPLDSQSINLDEDFTDIDTLLDGLGAKKTEPACGSLQELDNSFDKESAQSFDLDEVLNSTQVGTRENFTLIPHDKNTAGKSSEDALDIMVQEIVAPDDGVLSFAAAIDSATMDDKIIIIPTEEQGKESNDESDRLEHLLKRVEELEEELLRVNAQHAQSFKDMEKRLGEITQSSNPENSDFMGRLQGLEDNFLSSAKQMNTTFRANIDDISSIREQFHVLEESITKFETDLEQTVAGVAAKVIRDEVLAMFSEETQ